MDRSLGRRSLIPRGCRANMHAVDKVSFIFFRYDTHWQPENSFFDKVDPLVDVDGNRVQTPATPQNLSAFHFRVFEKKSAYEIALTSSLGVSLRPQGAYRSRD